MTAYVSFDAVIEPMVWGANTYTILRLPTEVVDALGQTKRVEGEFGEHPINLALAKAPVIDGVFLWTGKSLLHRIGITPGEVFEARLRPVADDIVEVPGDVTRALRSAGVMDAWAGWTPGRKRRALHQIETAKRVETRAKRISVLCRDLAG